MRELAILTAPIFSPRLKTKRLVIAIDGPAASGKSTTARLVAEKLRYLHVDTGAMYRAITLKVLRSGIRLTDREGVGKLAASVDIRLRSGNGSPVVLLDGCDVTQDIRSIEVTRAVSTVSSYPEVREAMVREQRKLGAEGGIVLEGRDIGTVVFPDADLKIYMEADIDARAQRRLHEMRRGGLDADARAVRHALQERDSLDSTRAASPLRMAEDAIKLDTSHLTIEQQVDFVVQKAQEIIDRRG